MKIGKAEKENLFNEIKETFFRTTELNSGCAQSSVIQALNNEKSLAENINKLDIDNTIPDKTEDIMLSKIQSMAQYHLIILTVLKNGKISKKIWLNLIFSIKIHWPEKERQ